MFSDTSAPPANIHFVCFAVGPFVLHYVFPIGLAGSAPVEMLRLVRQPNKRQFLRNKQIHFGEILELILSTHKATEHQVVEDKVRTQYSIVYFAIPDHNAVLPDGTTVGAWIDERISRSRKETA